MSHARNASALDPRSLDVHFAPEVRQAFGDLAAALHFSEHIDADILGILEDWAGEKSASIHDVLLAFPLIAERTFGHIRATGDQRAVRAWHDIGEQLLEKGFSVERYKFRSA